MSPEVKKFIEENIVLIKDAKFQDLFDVALCQLDDDHIAELEEIFLYSQIYKEKYLPFYYSMHRVHQIKCYNVGFGDCFLCKDNSDDLAKMLVDCGKYNSTPPQKVITDVLDELNSAKYKYLMLSHLHQDHYSGLNRLFEGQSGLQFNAVYLPNYITNGSLELYAAMIFLAPNTPLGREARDVLRIPGLLQKNLAPHAKICFLSEGGIVYNHLCNFEVLLPKRTRPRLWNEEVTPIKEFCNKYREFLGYIENSDGSVVVSINVEKDIIDLVDKFYANANQDSIIVDKTKFEELKKHYKTNRNELSLAFHECLVDDDKNVLFLGDSLPEDIKYLANNAKLRNHYYFIKIQHHGTRNYFYSKMPRAKYYAIPNGGSKDGWKITNLYNYCYGGNTTFICSNSCNCELTQHGIPCHSKIQNNATCGITQTSITIKIP